MEPGETPFPGLEEDFLLEKVMNGICVRGDTRGSLPIRQFNLSLGN